MKSHNQQLIYFLLVKSRHGTILEYMCMNIILINPESYISVCELYEMIGNV